MAGEGLLLRRFNLPTSAGVISRRYRALLNEKIARIEALRAELNALRPLKPEDEHRLWQKLRLEWNYNSNHIEGNTLTYGETSLLLIHGKTMGDHTMREFEEMKAHDVAVSKVRDWSADERGLTEADVRDLNRILLKEPFWKEAITADGQPTRVQIFPGEYKRQPNNVRLPNGEIFQFASVEETGPRMKALMEWFAKDDGLDPIERAARFHHEFVLIHPFGDGNGRTARLVVNYTLMKAGYMPIVIKSADKKNYLSALQLADAGDLLPLTEYLAEQEVWALELGLKAARGESLVEPEDLDKRIDVLIKRAGSVDPDKTVQRTFSKEALLGMYDEWIGPLFSRLIPIVQKFHPMFFGMRHHINVMSVVGEGQYRSQHQFAHCQFVNESAPSVVAKLHADIAGTSDLLTSGAEITFTAFLGSLRHLGDRAVGCRYQLAIHIDYHSFKVVMDKFSGTEGMSQSEEVERGLLHKKLSSTRLDELSRAFGSALADHVESWDAIGGTEPRIDHE